MDPLPVDRSTSRAVDTILQTHAPELLLSRINASAVFSSTSTIGIARAPLLWQAASASAPDLILTINPHWWNALSRDNKAAQLLTQLQRIRPAEGEQTNYLGRATFTIARDA